MTCPESVRLKIERANQHISDLQAESRRFLESGPYTIRAYRDPQSRRQHYILTRCEALPLSLAIITGDAIQNLRSALDHMAYLLFRTGKVFRESLSFFPIAESSPKYKTEALGKIKGFRQEVIDAISRFEPYGGGAGNSLWTLHVLSKIDKHRLLVPVLTSYRHVALPIFDMMFKPMQDAGMRLPPKDSFGFLALTPKERTTLKVGSILYVDAPDAEVNENIKFTFDVALHEPGIIKCEPILPALQGFVDIVSNVVSELNPLIE